MVFVEMLFINDVANDAQLESGDITKERAKANSRRFYIIAAVSVLVSLLAGLGNYAVSSFVFDGHVFDKLAIDFSISLVINLYALALTCWIARKFYYALQKLDKKEEIYIQYKHIAIMVVIAGSLITLYRIVDAILKWTGSSEAEQIAMRAFVYYILLLPTDVLPTSFVIYYDLKNGQNYDHSIASEHSKVQSKSDSKASVISINS